MEMRNCLRCKKVFNYKHSPICPSCEQEDEKTFEAVRVFVKENPEASLAVVAESTEVSVKKITRWIKEGRLEISRGMHGELVCMNCAKPIAKGKYCDACVIELNHQVDNLFTTAGPKMHTKKSDGKHRMYTAERKK